MRISLSVLIFLMTACVSLSVTEKKGGPVDIKCGKTQVTAYVGGAVTIDCKYQTTQENNIKSFCRVEGNVNCSRLISAYISNYTLLGRFSLRDDKQKKLYTVIISTLTHEDAGRYQCAMENTASNSTECLIEIHLKILNWDEITPVATPHLTGESAQIKCPYPISSESTDRFLCKGENPFKCEELIHTTELDREGVNGKFSISEDKGNQHFFVHITNLSTADSGIYWCGSDRTRLQDKYTKFHLSVGPPALQAAATQSSTPAGPSDDPPYFDMRIAVAVCVGLLVMALVLLLLLIPWTQGGSSGQTTTAGHNTEENPEDHHNEEMQELNNQMSSGDALPSIYAVVNLPADPLHYASISLQKGGNTVSDTNKNDFSVCDYSSIRTQGGTCPPTAEQPLYSTVTMPGQLK